MTAFSDLAATIEPGVAAAVGLLVVFLYVWTGLPRPRTEERSRRNFAAVIVALLLLVVYHVVVYLARG